MRKLRAFTLWLTLPSSLARRLLPFLLMPLPAPLPLLLPPLMLMLMQG